MQVDLKNYHSPYFHLKEEVKMKLAQNKTQISKEKDEVNLKEKDLKDAENKEDKGLLKTEENGLSGADGGEKLDLYEKLQELLSEIAKLSAKMQNTKDEHIKEILLKQIMVLNAQVMEIAQLIQELEAKSQTSV